MKQAVQERTHAAQAAGAVIVNGDGAVLLVRRGRPPLEGAWTLPGGRVEPGESPEEAIVREAHEETSLRVRVVAKIAVVPLDREGYAYDIHEYLCVPVSRNEDLSVPTLRAGDDAAEARWVDPDTATELGLSAAARKVIDEGLGIWRVWRTASGAHSA